MSDRDISASLQNYIKAIYELTSGGGEGARITDIASRIGVTKTSAFTAVKKLEREKLIARDENRLVRLTEEGEHKAVLALDKAEIFRQFFVNVLEVSPEIADADARALEHSASIKTLCRICGYNYRAANKAKSPDDGH